MERQLNAATDWIGEQQEVLDELLAKAGRSYFERLRSRPNALYDLGIANQESYRLSQGKDLCYDRPAIGLVYGLWYHARRVNTNLGLVLKALWQARGQEIQAYDLGAGTGAFQWALALGCAAMKAQGADAPRIRVINVDTSPFMLHYLEHLWQALAVRYDACEAIDHECRLNTWSRSRRPLPNTWLCASYLFDHEDKEDDLSRDFDQLVDKLQPRRVFLSTSDQKGKKRFMRSIGGQLRKQRYEPCDTIDRPVYSGSLSEVNQLRSKVRGVLRNGIENRQRANSMRPAATWNERSFTGSSFVREQAEPRSPLEHIELFTPHVEERLDVKLSDDQADAAEPDDHPTVIYGPAGCGKSIVITERVKNIVEKHDYSTDLRILVTTFNKQLEKKVLRPWLEELLDEDRYRSVNPTGDSGEPCRDFYFDLEPGQRTWRETPNIKLMHFDVLPTRIGAVHKSESGAAPPFYETMEYVERASDQVRKSLKKEEKRVSRFEHVLDPQYIWNEFHRVYFGLWENKRESYLHCARPGRPRLDRDKAPRRVLWRCMSVFNELCREDNFVTTTHRRIALYQRLGRMENHFTHLFVDELQDCTHADFAIFHRLLGDPNQLVVAGDLAQAVHLGLTASVRNLPRLPRSEQKDRRYHPLIGSYRLPFRISEALVPLSARVQEKRRGMNDVSVLLQNPYRGSPPGARPIFVWAQSTEAMARKVKAVRRAYDSELGNVGFELKQCSILEQDTRLRQALNDIDVKAESNTILRMKGLEKTCLLWSTRIPVEGEEVEEFAYTILTRGARLLIVALFPDVCEEFKPIINTFDCDRIILWDRETEWHFGDCCEDVPVAGDYEEQDEELKMVAAA